MVVTAFSGVGVGFGAGIGCGFGIGWGFGGASIQTLGLGIGGGCGVGLGVGWGLGSGYGSRYFSSKIRFEGVEIEGPKQQRGDRFGWLNVLRKFPALQEEVEEEQNQLQEMKEASSIHLSEKSK